MNETSDLFTPSSDRKKILFGMPRVGSSIVLGMEGFASFDLYYTGFGVPALLVTLAQALGYLIIGLSQFFFGWYSDVKYTKLGRRKPYILVLSPLLGISYIFILLPNLMLPSLDDKLMLFFWFLLWDSLFKVSYSLTTVYQAWMAEQFIVGERPKVSQIQNIFNYIGSALMGIVTFIILKPYIEVLEGNVNAPIPMNLLAIIIIFGAVAMSIFFLVAILMPNEPHFKIDTKLKENLKIIVKNRNYIYALLMIGISSFAWSIIADMMLTYTGTVLGLESTTEYIIIAVFLIIGILAFLYLWRLLIQKRGKKYTLLNVMLLGVLFLPFTLLGLIPLANYMILGIIFIIFIGAILGGWFLFPYIIYADYATDDEKATGDLKAGVYAGFPALLLNAFQAFGVMVLGVAVESLPAISIGTATYSLGLIIWGPICSVVLLIAYLYTKRFVILDFEWEK